MGKCKIIFKMVYINYGSDTYELYKEFCQIPDNTTNYNYVAVIFCQYVNNKLRVEPIIKIMHPEVCIMNLGFNSKSICFKPTSDYLDLVNNMFNANTMYEYDVASKNLDNAHLPQWKNPIIINNDVKNTILNIAQVKLVGL